jgi:tetratricopeptide (TPR) repeat protein
VSGALDGVNPARSEPRSSARFERGLVLAVACAALVYEPSALAAEPKRVCGLLLTTVALSLAIARASNPQPCRPGLRFGLGFIALSAFSLAWGLPGGARELGTLYLALGGAVLTRGLAPEVGRRVAQSAALVIGGVAAAWVLGAAALGGEAMRLHAGQGNPNWLGLLLAMTLPLSLGAWRAQHDLRARVSARLALAASLVQIPALYCSHSRVAWLAAAAALSWWGAASGSARRRRFSSSSTVALALGMLGVFFGVSALFAKQDVPAAVALSGRLWIWRHSAHAAFAALPFGAGLGRFAHSYLDAQGRALAELPVSEAARRFTNATSAHEEFLQVTLESGPIAALCLLLALGLSALEHARAGFRAGTAALIACLVAALGDSPLRQPAVTLLLGLVVGVGALRSAPSGPPALPAGAGGRLALVALLSGAAFLTYDSTRAWFGSRERSRALEHEPMERLTGLARSARLDPASGETWLELGLLRLRLGDAAVARAQLERAAALLADTATRTALGIAELSLRHPELATQAFERALDWSPGSFRARLGLAEAHFRARRLHAAEREAGLARKLMPGDPRVRELLDAIHEAEADR